MTAEKTAWVGLSHLGIVSGTGWASLVGPVLFFDLDGEKVAAMERGELSIHEPGLVETLASARPRVTCSADPRSLAECAVVVVARDVPTNDANESDLTPVEALLDAVLPHLAPGATLVVMSQVSAGFTRRLRERVTRADVEVVYWVETLVFGRAVERFLRPERIILGLADPKREVPRALAAGLACFGCPVLPLSYESAELTKTAINLYLCASVTYANTMSDLCEAVGADWATMMPALRLDKRIGQHAYIAPSLGIAGGNLERDMVTLARLGREHDLETTFIDSMLAYNGKRRSWVHRKLDAHVFRDVAKPVLAVWGLTYKRDTRSTKNSMSLLVLADIGERAEVRAFDPLVDGAEVPPNVTIVKSAAAALAGADALIVLTDHREFEALPAGAVATMRRHIVIDAVGVVDRSSPELADATFVAMGACAR